MSSTCSSFTDEDEELSVIQKKKYVDLITLSSLSNILGSCKLGVNPSSTALRSLIRTTRQKLLLLKKPNPSQLLRPAK